MARHHESRFENHCETIRNFLKSDRTGENLILYPNELKRLEKEFNNTIKIEQGDRFKDNLFICHVTRN